MDISVVIPTMDEEATIGDCIKKAKAVFKEMKLDAEIIVADNSMDRTPQIAKKLGAKVIIPKKLGYGNAYLTGLAEAKGKYIVIADGDGTYDLTEMPDLLGPLMRGEADFVMGNRFNGNMQKGAMPWLHEKVGNPFLSWLVRKMYGADVSDSHCGMRAFTKDSYEKMGLKSGGMEFASEMVIKAVKEKLRMQEVPVAYYPRVAPSKLNSFKDGWRHLEFIFLYNPKQLFIYPGISLLLLGIVLMTLAMFSVKIFWFAPQLHSMIMAGMAILVGFQLVSLGIFSGMYIQKFGIWEADGLSKFLINVFSSKKGLVFGIILVICGAVMILWILANWVGTNLGELSYQSRTVLSSTLMVGGIEVVYTYLFSKMLNMER